MKNKLLLFQSVLCIYASLAAAEQKIIADFEDQGYGAWMCTGQAFGNGPTNGTLPNQAAVKSYVGLKLVNSYHGGDSSVGKLKSPEFLLEMEFVNFKIGGGNHPGLTCINLIVDGKKVKTATGINSERLFWCNWNVKEYMGKKAFIEIVDNETAAWGHICVDHIHMSDNPRGISADSEKFDRELLTNELMKEAQEAAQNDANRPSYHFRPTALWMNDINGPVYYNGYYHIFYQMNPYDDVWQPCMHWGHAKSKDLVHWEIMPIAMWPSLEFGETGCYSGCAAYNNKNELMFFYTKASELIGPQTPYELWAAVPEDTNNLTRLKKYTKNPLLTIKSHGGPRVNWDWRDACVFRESGRAYIVIGATGCGLPVYEAMNDSFTTWKFRNIMFDKDAECPQFAKINDKWILILSDGGPEYFFTGTFDSQNCKFTAKRAGLIDYSKKHHYASYSFYDRNGSFIILGWIPGFKLGTGWNGCMAIPRIIEIDENYNVSQKPIPQMALLRGKSFDNSHLKLDNNQVRVQKIDGNSAEILAEFTDIRSRKIGIRVRCSEDSKEFADISFDGNRVSLDEFTADYVPIADSIKIYVFVDRSVVEVFIDNKICFTKVVYLNPKSNNVEIYAQNGTTDLNLKAWELKPIW